MIDLSASRESVYIQAFEKPDGLAELGDALSSSGGSLTQRQKDLLYDIYAERVRYLLSVRPDAGQLCAFSKHIAEARHLFERLSDPLAIQLAVLEDLAEDARFVADELRVERILGRDHVRVALRLIGYNQTISRAAFRSKLGTGEANTSRILRMLERAALIERTQHGRATHLALTNFGRDVVARSFDTTPQLTDDRGGANSCGHHMRSLICYHQGSFIQYMLLAAEKHRKLKDEYKNGHNIERLSAYTQELIGFLNTEFSASVYKTFALLKTHFLDSGRAGPRLCLKFFSPGGPNARIISVFRDSGVDYNSDTGLQDNTGYLHVATTGTHYLENDISDAFLRRKYMNPRLNYHKWHELWGAAGAQGQFDWDKCWKGYDAAKAGDVSFYRSTMIVPLTVWNNRFSDDFKSIMEKRAGSLFGNMRNFQRTVFGLLCFDHRLQNFFVEDDVLAGYVAADMLSLYMFTRIMYVDMSVTVEKVSKILEEQGIPPSFALPEPQKVAENVNGGVGGGGLASETPSSENFLSPPDGLLRAAVA